MPPEAYLDPVSLDLNHIVADAEEIRRVNPQRFEMEQLTAIVLLDLQRFLVAGYKDVTPNEFWVRGHMPGYPLMPGVLMCEAAAQLASFYVVKAAVLEGDFIGFGGMDNVKFRGVVRPGDRLVLVSKAVKLHRRQTIFDVQGFVGAKMVFQGAIHGIPMSRKEGA